jgi:hypothetical protein
MLAISNCLVELKDVKAAKKAKVPKAAAPAAAPAPAATSQTQANQGAAASSKAAAASSNEEAATNLVKKKTVASGVASKISSFFERKQPLPHGRPGSSESTKQPSPKRGNFGSTPIRKIVVKILTPGRRGAGGAPPNDIPVVAAKFPFFTTPYAEVSNRVQPPVIDTAAADPAIEQAVPDPVTDVKKSRRRVRSKSVGANTAALSVSQDLESSTQSSKGVPQKSTSTKNSA